MSLNLEELGITHEDLTERVVEKLCDQLLNSYSFNEDGHASSRSSQFRQSLDTLVKTKIDEKVAALADAHILPIVSTYVENLCLAETNKWGEKKGTTFTFIEYMVARAETYLTEFVDRDGKGKDESGNYGWTKATSRISWMIHQHLHHNIKGAMELALKDVNSKITGGLENAVKIALADAREKLKVDVRI